MFPKRYYIILLFLTLFATISLFAFVAEEDRLTYLLVFLLFIATSIPFVIAAMRGSFDTFEIIHPFSVLFFLYFGVRSIYVMTAEEEKASTMFLVPEFINRALLYTVVGFIALLLGYYSRLSASIAGRLPGLYFNPDRRRTTLVIMVLYGIGALSRGFYFLFGRQVGVSSVYNLVDYFFTFAPWALLLFLIEYFSDKGTLGKSLFLWGGFLPSEIVFTFLRPGRAYLLSIIFGCLIIYHYLKRRIRVLLIAAVFVLIIVLFFPAISAVKPLAWEGLSPKFSTFSTDIDLMQKEISLKFQDTTFWGYFENAYHEIMNRIHGIDSFTTIIAYTPASIEYQYGRTIIATLGFLLPQFIREKTFLKNLDEDILSLGRRMGCIYYGTEQEIAGIIIMQIAELYLNFSLYGVIIGMFMLGVFYRVFYLYFIVKNPHRFSLFIYTILCFWVVMPEYWFIHAYENFIKQLLMLFAIVWCLNGGRVFKGSPRTFVRRG